MRKKIKQNLDRKNTHGEGKERPISQSSRVVNKSFGIDRYPATASETALKRPLRIVRSNDRTENRAKKPSRRSEARARSLVPSSHPLERTARRTSRSKKKNARHLDASSCSNVLFQTKKAVGKNRCVEIVPAALRCDATYLDLGGLGGRRRTRFVE